MVSQESPEQEEFFPGGEAAVYFSNANECVGKMRGIIENKESRDRLAAGAHEIARRHTYLQRAGAILEALRIPATETDLQ